ncbi:hypothetical protein [Niabella beijingensis]|uniref:hypothetical protein n=1 Tax=Niabella beijingensis TaxID=2872700 RepID=UPI001CBF237E|nr:hypothetical protein [Niabella beijingensis]MBZ4188536.1 hypothetical protein [Niabella beijingensis]
MTEQDPHSVFDTETDPELEHQLLTVSRWTRFITVIGFSFGAFLVVAMLFNGAAILKEMEGLLPVQVEGAYSAMIITFFIFFFAAAALLYFLYNAATYIKAGVLQKNAALVAEGFANFRRFFIAIAIFAGFSLLANLSILFQ